MTSLAALLRSAAPPDARPDGDLLAAFLAHRDEFAFGELVRRHGPVVWAACRRLLPDPSDAEDAFQATFLVLVRRAGKLTRHPALGPWLYKVAALTARNLRRRNARTLARLGPLPAEMPAASPDPDLRPDLDAALLGLPEKYRTPLLLCHLQGWSRKDAAAQLGCPEGTLSAWLSRGLARLRRALAGCDPAMVLAVPAVAVPGSIASATVRAAVASRLAVTGAVSSTVSQLAEGVLHMFWVKKATAATLALTAVFAFGLGVGVSVRYVPTTMAAADDKTPAKAGAASAEGSALQDKLKAAEEAFHKARQVVYVVREQVRLASRQPDPAVLVMAMVALHQVENHLKACFNEYVALRAQSGASDATPEVGAADGQPVPFPADLMEAYIYTYRQTIHFRQMIQLTTKRVEELEYAVSQFDNVRRNLETTKKDLANHRAELAKYEAHLASLEKRGARLPLPPATPLEVTIGGDALRWQCSVTEYGPDGKPVGTLTCDTPDIFRAAFTRAAKQTPAPTELRVKFAGAPAERIRAVLEVCKAAGFKEAKVTGPFPEQETRTVLVPPKNEPKTETITVHRVKNETAALDDLLRKLPPRAP